MLDANDKRINVENAKKKAKYTSMMNKPRILFIADKWCSGNSDYGLSEWEGNLWQSLQAVNLAEVEVFHFDEYYRTNKIKGDGAVLEKIAEFKPQAICLVIYKHPSAFNTPSLKTLERIRRYFSVPLFAIWGDPYPKELEKLLDIVQPFIDFNIFTATSAVFRRWKDPKKFSYFWVPKNPEYFYDPGRPRDIDISYPGSTRPVRLRKIKYLEKHGLKVYHAGGERQEHLPIAEFAEIFQRSKIILSFTRVGHTDITCARAFEATNCGAMLLEEACPEAAKLFIPNVDYVPYFSKTDLLKKARYYLQNEAERAKIANRGYLKTQQYYSAYRFWKIVFDKAEEMISSATRDKIFRKNEPYQLDHADDRSILANWGRKTIEFPWSRLKRLSLAQALTLKTTDWFCSYRLSYSLYLWYRRIKDWRWLLFTLSYACFKAARHILPKRLGDRLKESLKPCAKIVKTN